MACQATQGGTHTFIRRIQNTHLAPRGASHVITSIRPFLTHVQARLPHLASGLVLASLALTPSLVPRPTLFQGFLAGLWFMIGFGLGNLMRNLGRRLRTVLPGRLANFTPSLRTAWVLRTVALLALFAYLLSYASIVVHWQNEVRALVEMDPVDGAAHVVFVLAALVTMVLCWGIARGISSIASLAARRVAEAGGSVRTAAWTSSLTSVLTTVLLAAVLVGGGLVAVGKIYAGRDAGTLDGSVRPTLPTRSGSAESAAAWDGLGRQGRAFAGGGPSADAIAKITGTAIDPVRVYAGLSQGADMLERATLVVDELERTGGFEREVLLVATPTGSGWLEPQAIAAFEYLYAGDTATASMQYSYQPSWVSFLFDPELATASSAALFDAVYERWEQLPREHRPRLAVYGLSLGAAGMQGHFTDLDEMLQRTDAALFTGPPANSEPWRTLQNTRDDSSPIWRPIYQQGTNVRWQSKPGDFLEPAGTWEQPRIGYLQHATDPITWLDPAVIYQRPEWLGGSAAEGGRGADVSDAMAWMPGITYMHLVTDMLVSEAVPPSHGHNFGDVALDAWAHVLPGHGLSDPQLDAVQELIAGINTHDPIWE